MSDLNPSEQQQAETPRKSWSRVLAWILVLLAGVSVVVLLVAEMAKRREEIRSRTSAEARAKDERREAELDAFEADQVARARAEARVAAKLRAEADRLVAAFKPADHEKALRNLERAVQKRDWAQASLTFEQLHQQVAPAMWALDGYSSDRPDVRQFVDRYTRQRKALRDRNSYMASISAGVDERVTAPKLVGYYMENEIAADQRFKDKTLLVSGTVVSIGKDIMDTPYVTLSAEPYETFRTVQASFTKDAEGDLAYLRRGQHVQVRCHCRGLFMNVQLNQCVPGR